MTPKPKTTFGSARALARELNRAHSTIASWLALPDWPASRNPPWDEVTLTKIREWVAHRNAACKSPDLQAARGELLTEQLELLNLSNAIASGEYVNAVEAKRLMTAAAVQLQHGLSTIGFKLAVRGDVRGGERGGEAITAFLRDELEQLANEFTKQINDVPAQSTAEPEPLDLAIIGAIAERPQGAGDARPGAAGPAGTAPEGKGTTRQGGGGGVRRVADRDDRAGGSGAGRRARAVPGRRARAGGDR